MKYFILLFFMGACLLTGGIRAADGAEGLTPEEYKLRAAYLYNFSKFIRWPETTFENESTPFVIGVAGGDGPLESLTPLSGRKIGAHPIEIRQFKPGDPIGYCHLLYVQMDAGLGLPEIMRIKEMRVITVGDDPDFADEGGMIQFVIIRNRLRFIINMRAAKLAGVTVDSRLLSLAIELRE